MDGVVDTTEEADFKRRFGGVERLYGARALRRFTEAHICVIGVGGVGSWAVEALARSAIGTLTLIDLDNIAVSNVNRQLHAISPDFGKAKVSALAERCHSINPQIVVHEIEDFVTLDNVAELLVPTFDYVIDAIDQMRTKTAVIAHCYQTGIPLITTGAAGGQIDATRIGIDDLARTIQDPLLSKVRARLRKEYAFPRGDKVKFGVDAVYSSEPLRYPDLVCEAGSALVGLNCSGFGSAVTVTASFGLFAAGRVLQRLAEGAGRS